MSNTYTGNLDVTPVVFTSEPAQFFPDDRQGTMVEIDTLPSVASVDDIFYFNSPTSDKYLARVIDGSMRAAYCGIYTANSGSVNATRLSDAANHPLIRTIIFDDPTGGVFSFSGIVSIPENVRIEFKEGK